MTVQEILNSLQNRHVFALNRNKIILQLIPYIDRIILAKKISTDPVTQNILCIVLDVMGEYLQEKSYEYLPEFRKRELN